MGTPSHSLHPIAEHGHTDKRQQILAGSEKVFIRCGYEGASMSRIAIEANVSKGTLYNYFTNKAELFEAFIKYYIAQDVVTLIDLLHSAEKEGQKPKKTLEVLGERFIYFLISPRMISLHRIIASEAEKFPHISEILWTHVAQYCLTTMKNWLDKKVAQKQLHIADTELASHLFFTLCQTEIVSKKRLNIPIVNMDQRIRTVIEAAVRLFVSGYGQ